MIAILKIIAAILLGLFVLGVGSFIISFDNLSELMGSQPWVSGFINHTNMLVLSLLIILLLSRGRIKAYGFRFARAIHWKGIALWSLSMGVGGSLIEFLIPGEELTFLGEFSFFQVVIFIWIYASICEEILTRGLIQGYLGPLTKYGFTLFGSRISLPVLVGALFFGSMHLALLTMGVSGLLVLTIVFFAFILGIIAGFYRERTGSIIPAIVTHMAFNISGTITGLIVTQIFNFI